LSTVGRKLFLFYQNWMDVKLICQTARDVLKLITFDRLKIANFWRIHARKRSGSTNDMQAMQAFKRMDPVINQH
jgi:hypothetical protein